MNPKCIYTSYFKKVPSVDDFNTDKFILEVQQRECIWNVNSKSYNLKCIRNRETKRKAWEEIGRIFHPNWDTLSVDERQKRVEALSKKWANIRKYYTDEVRKPATFPPKKRRRRYHHLLSFLDDSVLKRRVPRINEFKNIAKDKVGNECSSDSESGELFIVEDDDELQRLENRYEVSPTPGVLDNKSINSKPYFVDEREPGKGFNLWDKPAAPVKPAIQNKSIDTEMAQKNPEIMKLLNENRSRPPVNKNLLCIPPVDNSSLYRPPSLEQTAEASKRFLLSLLPEIMSLNVRQNLQFRLGIMDLLNDIKLRVNPSVNPTLFPNHNFN